MWRGVSHVGGLLMQAWSKLWHQAATLGHDRLPTASLHVPKRYTGPMEDNVPADDKRHQAHRQNGAHQEHGGGHDVPAADSNHKTNSLNHANHEAHGDDRGHGGAVRP